MFKKLSLLFVCVCLMSCLTLNAQLKTDEPVVCIHGFLGAPWTMQCYAGAFEKEGVPVTNWGYPSRDKTIAAHAEDLVKELQIIASELPAHPIHFVTHSMGGLVLRAALNHPLCPEEAKVGKAVLLAPPNQGACWGRFLERFSFVKRIAKEEAGRELMTEEDFEHLGQFPASIRVLVIAGDLSLNPLIPVPNDGTVTVEETYLTTPHEHAVVHAGHKGILINNEALSLTKAFIEQE
jgi:hypothetical protein